MPDRFWNKFSLASGYFQLTVISDQLTVGERKGLEPLTVDHFRHLASPFPGLSRVSHAISVSVIGPNRGAPKANQAVYPYNRGHF